MFRVHVTGGYSGQYGYITACREIMLPCAPYPGLWIETDQWIEEITEVSWAIDRELFRVSVKDSDDTGNHGLSWWESNYRERGWEVMEVCPTAPEPD